MASTDISEDVRQFIFEYIDSVEQLDILLFLRFNRGRAFDPDQIGTELRLNANSVKTRLAALHAANLVDSNLQSPEAYIFSGRRVEIENVLENLSVDYRVKKHKVLELIFSPAKRARQFANAFTIGKKNGGEGDHGG